jgi:hypothetical protein
MGSVFPAHVLGNGHLQRTGVAAVGSIERGRAVWVFSLRPVGQQSHLQSLPHADVLRGHNY